MQYDHNKEQAQEYARLVINRLKRDGLSPTPTNYELWYVYYSGQSPEVTKAVDSLIANSEELSNERCIELYERFLGDSFKEDVFVRAGDEITHTIETFNGAVREAKHATSEYGGVLGDLNGRIGSTTDPEQLRVILNSVLEETQSMIEHNGRLEHELDQSSEAMARLQHDLEAIRLEAMTDGLTGLANRKSFDAEIDRIYNEAKADESPFCLMMLDIDHFKSFNDHYGHQIGDQVLRLVAKTLVDGVKGRDVAARYGGEEFSIILPDTPLEGAIKVGEALRKAVATKDVINRSTGEKMGRITMSVGIAEFTESESIDALIERADSALYTAKHNGRNQVAAAPSAAGAKPPKTASY